jgi:hypothetical protein
MSDQIATLSERVRELEKSALAAELAMVCMVQYLVDTEVVDCESLRAYIEASADEFENSGNGKSPEARAYTVDITNKLRAILPSEDRPKP